VVATATATVVGVPNPLQSHTPPSSLFDQNPVISELLRQISLSKSAVVDLRASLKESQTVAVESHLAIQHDLDTQRERKRAEDAAKVELKTKNKTLEEGKRSAEAVKREADKKLKQAETARDKAAERIERLDKEIEALKERMGEDVRVMLSAKEEGDLAEEELVRELELKKKEVKVAEDVVAALNARAKDLEEKIVLEEERLKEAKEQAELRKQDRAFFPLHVVHTEEPSVPIASPWSPLIPPQISVDPHTYIHSDLSAGIEVFPHSLHVPGTRSRGGSGSSGSGNPVPTDFSVSPRPRKLSLGVLSNLHPSHAAAAEQVNAELAVQRPNGFPGFDDNLSGRSTRFAPFADTNELEVPVNLMHDIGAPSPKSSSLIPTSLIASLEGVGGNEDLSRSFQSDTDDFLERDWRKTYPFPPQPVESPAVYSSSPTSLTQPSFDGVDKEDPFEIRPPPRHRFASDISDMQRAVFSNPSRSSSDPQAILSLSRSRTRESDEVDLSSVDEKATGHRRWFSGSPSTKEKKGLNPEAKVFQFKKPFTSKSQQAQAQRLSQLETPLGGLRSMPISAPLNLTLLSSHNYNSSMLPPPPQEQEDSIFSSLSMHAFAPSPAEREELARRLGSSANTSLERIPTLSEVSIGSLPSSPNHVHARAAAAAPQQGGGRTMGMGGLPAWLAALPKVRKTKFSPWEDESAEGEGNGNASF